MDYHKLNEVFQFVRKNSPFYGDLYTGLPDTVDDVSDLPIIDHTEYWSANTLSGNRVLTRPLTEAVVLKTGGTTGAPKFACYTRGEWNEFVAGIAESMAENGLRHGHRVANLFYGGELYASFLLWQDSLTAITADNVRLPIGGAASPEAVHTALKDFDVQVTCSTPTTICRVAGYMLEHGHQLPSVEIIFFAGEPVFEDQRRLLATAFPNAEICAAIYGSTDAGIIGRPLRGTDQRIFRAPDHDTVLEIVDDTTGKPITETGRSGRLIKTDLRRRLMPVLRYPVGDRAQWLDHDKQLFRLQGRHAEGVRIGPVSLYTEDFRHILNKADTAQAIIGMQLVERRTDGLDHLLIRLAARPDYTAKDTLTQTLLTELHTNRPMISDAITAGIIGPPTIEWKTYNELHINPRTGKLMPVIDERPTQ
jgi:phenylacetate-CoA ligase